MDKEFKAFLKRYRIEFAVAALAAVLIIQVIYTIVPYDNLREFSGEYSGHYKIMLLVFSAAVFLLAWISYPKIFKFKVLLSAAALVSFLVFMVLIYVNVKDVRVMGIRLDFMNMTWYTSGKFILYFIITLLNVNLLLIIMSKASINYEDGQKLSWLLLAANFVVFFTAVYALSAGYLGSDETRISTSFIKGFERQFIPFNFLLFVLIVLISFFNIEEEHNYGSIIVGIAIMSFYCVLTADKVYQVRMSAVVMAVLLIIGILVHWLNSLHHKANYDPLLKIYNRQYMQGIMSGIVDVKLGDTFSVLMCDIDHFKKVNDTYGHEAGDIVLFRVAQAIRDAALPQGVVCRYGGEEIIVFLRDKGGDEAKAKAEQIRKAVKGLSVKVKSKRIKTSLSIGVASSSRPHGPAEKIIKKADEGVYKAKKRGRNRVVCIK